MTTLSSQTEAARQSEASGALGSSLVRIALLGNPNTGKTTLFNRLCGLRAKTANFPGSTVEARIGRYQITFGAADSDLSARRRNAEIVDLPGLYSTRLKLPESELCRQVLEGDELLGPAPDIVVVVADATNLARNLRLVAEAISFGHRTLVALNMIDIAQRRGLTIDTDKLGARLGCPVIAMCARSGLGVDKVNRALATLLESPQSFPPSFEATPESAEEQPYGNGEGAPAIPDSTDIRAITQWADQVVSDSVGGAQALGHADDTFTDRLDAAFTHPILGLLTFGLVMGGLFATIFWLAQWPMEWIGVILDGLGTMVSAVMPAGALHDLLVDGIIGGIAGVVVFLPQICLLFFLLSLLEDTGYLARAAFVMDRFLCRFGLPGQAFVPLLSSHACAIPGIMATKLIPDPKDRLATILVAPFMSCSARLPVYVLLISLLFAGRPLLAGMAFFGCYALGAIAALATAWIARTTILRGDARPMVLELPTYKWPSIQSAFLTTIDRGVVFLKNAGTVIMAICVVLWWLTSYPGLDQPSSTVTDLQARAAVIAASDPVAAEALSDEAARLFGKEQSAHSFAGRIGATVQPVFAPLGYDDQLTIAVLCSFAAREVFVSTMAVLTAAGDDLDNPGIIARIQNAQRSDGKGKVFTTRTCVSLLVFYVLAMQCLPTLAVTRRETGSWKWAGLQLAYMSGLAYVFAFAAYHATGLLLGAA